MNKKIFVTIVSLGSKEKIIKIDAGSNSLELRKLLKLNNSISLFRLAKSSPKLLHTNSKLKDADTIALVTPLKGAVDFKYNGRWRIHKSDKDGRPSNFHAHNYDKNQTVDLYTGIIYKTHTKQIVGQIPHKNMKQITENFKIKIKKQ